MDGRADGAREGSEHAWVLEAVAGVGEALIIIDAQPKLIYQNLAATRLVGIGDVTYDPEQWSISYGLFLPDERTLFPSAELPLLRALRRGEDVRDVSLFIKNAVVPQGVHVLSSANALRDPQTGCIRGAACIFRDISVIRAQQARLRESARQKKAILDNIADMAWLKDESGCFLLVNQRFAAAAGRRSPEEIVGLSDNDLWPADLAARYRTDDAEVIRTRQQLRVEEPHVDADGRHSWLESVKAAIIDDQGRVIGTTGIARDITERKRMEEDMRSAKDKLEQRVLEHTAELAQAQEILVRQERLAILGQLAGGVAHQIRNPLAAIMNATYVLRRHLSPDQHQHVEDAIRIIHDEVRHANIIITGLLDYARVRTPNRNPASIVELLDRILRADWIPPNIRVIRNLPNEDSVVREIDVDQLQAAMANVVRNAVDAMPNGGDLVVALATVGEEIVITVSDTGGGISPQVRSHLFEPLHSTKPMGIGLGLVTARRFIESHGGTIACVDVPKGARFQIRLPIR